MRLLNVPPKNLLINHEQHLHLLLYDGHWMAITKLSTLYRRTNISGGFYMCNTCLATFYNSERHENHLPCEPDGYIQTEIMPEEDLEFRDHSKAVDLADIVLCTLTWKVSWKSAMMTQMII